MELLDKFSKTTQDTDLRNDNTQAALVSKMLDNLMKTLHSSVLANVDGDLVKSSEDTERTLKDSMTSLGLPTNCDTDLRNRFSDDADREAQGKNDLEVFTSFRVAFPGALHGQLGCFRRNSELQIKIGKLEYQASGF